MGKCCPTARTSGRLLIFHFDDRAVSLIFILSFCGFASAAVINVWLTDRFGFGAVSTRTPDDKLEGRQIDRRCFRQVIATGAAVQLVSFSLICWAPPFGVFVFAMYLNGLGTGLQVSPSGPPFELSDSTFFFLTGCAGERRDNAIQQFRCQDAIHPCRI